ncbi:drebrin-like protein isoform X2 [Sardina pilchardus]|uniref:drebrin-like protein isoform X2 n=1 Tax=Sardina pilchardus TaxID=27697 RepID=UPI002E11F421
MPRYCVFVLLCLISDQTNGNIYIPVMFCLSEALLISVILNIYCICTRKKRPLIQRCHRFSLFRRCALLMDEEANDQQDDQAHNGDVQYCSVTFQKRKTQQEDPENEQQPSERQKKTRQEDPENEQQPSERQKKTRQEDPENEQQPSEGQKLQAEESVYSDVKHFGWE